MTRVESKAALVVLVGVDGAGKTTLSNRLGEGLAPHGVKSLSHRVISRSEPYAERSMQGVADLLWPSDNTTFDHLLPPEFYVYLKATWYALFSDLVLQPELKNSSAVIVDGWHYKFAAKMTLDGFSEHHLETVFSHVIEPDLVVMLDPDIDSIWERRTDFRSHELGLHEGYTKLGRQSFIDYQSKVRDKLLDMAKQQSWHVLRLEHGITIDDSYDRLRNLVLEWMDGYRQRQGAFNATSAEKGPSG